MTTRLSIRRLVAMLSPSASEDDRTRLTPASLALLLDLIRAAEGSEKDSFEPELRTSVRMPIMAVLRLGGGSSPPPCPPEPKKVTEDSAVNVEAACRWAAGRGYVLDERVQRGVEEEEWSRLTPLIRPTSRSAPERSIEMMGVFVEALESGKLGQLPSAALAGGKLNINWLAKKALEVSGDEAGNCTRGFGLSTLQKFISDARKAWDLRKKRS